MNKQLPAGYAELRPIADYAPWDTDRSFLTAYNRIKDNTLVDIYRCYSLWQLALQLRHLEGDVLEVGVWRGGTGALLTQALRDDPTCTIYLADTFRGVVKAGPRDDYYKGGEHANTSRETVEQLIAAVGGNGSAYSRESSRMRPVPGSMQADCGCATLMSMSISRHWMFWSGYGRAWRSAVSWCLTITGFSAARG